MLILPAFYHMLHVYILEHKKWKYFTLGFAFIFFSTLAAILRETYEFSTFRTLEWGCITLASILFAYACYHNYRSFCMEPSRGGEGG
ncbi:MAG: hypothetical protein B6U72_00270 [Candidatus Altiarchaeales archaeon ex4484_2]|nr:MAG: hypothetical protein B6U72_00270 [Candidatus Altiarchaeales archaeon ex4484_2]